MVHRSFVVSLHPPRPSLHPKMAAATFTTLFSRAKLKHANTGPTATLLTMPARTSLPQLVNKLHVTRPLAVGANALGHCEHEVVDAIARKATAPIVLAVPVQ